MNPDSFKMLNEAFESIFSGKPYPFTVKNENSTKSPLIPGRIVTFKIDDSPYFGFILQSDIIVYIDKTGKFQGYLTNCTLDKPYKIDKVFTPTKDHFKLSECNNMNLEWSRPLEKVFKTISEIEKELGLVQGTLEIK